MLFYKEFLLELQQRLHRLLQDLLELNHLEFLPKLRRPKIAIPSKRSRGSSKPAAEEVRDSTASARESSPKRKNSTSPDKKRAASTSRAKTSRVKRSKKRKRRRSSTSSSSSRSSSARKHRHRRKSSTKTKKRSKVRKNRKPSTPIKTTQMVLPASMTRDEHVQQFADLINGMVPTSLQADRLEVSAAVIDAGLRSLSSLSFFPNVEMLVSRILPVQGSMNIELLLRQTISAVMAFEATRASISPPFPPSPSDASIVATTKLAEAVRLMAKESSKSRRGDGVRRFGYPSDDEDEPVFDLASSLRDFNVANLPVNWFGDTMGLETLRKHFDRAKAAGKEWPHFLASSPFEDWIPPWVGSGASPSDKTNTLRYWKTKVEMASPSHAYSRSQTITTINSSSDS
ncbi:unnamed protein product [Polarella glacialis]|uniref:Uncharacterized protein n=1 Tax=Polarella glacialis TaxID=89957 RepID=A0A813HX93_POLGL|nr:unnamed protein product [Polarella glacialis]